MAGQAEGRMLGTGTIAGGRVGAAVRSLPTWLIPVAAGLAILVVYLLVGALEANARGSGPSAFLIWDGAWYDRIVEHGYAVQGVVMLQRPAAFFPLFPGTVRLVHGVLPGIPVVAVGLGLNVMATLAALALVVRSLPDWRPWQRTALCVLLLTLPGAVFYANFYSEAFFLLAMSLVVHGLRTPGRLPVASLGAALAGADRPTGVFVAAGVIVAIAVRADAGGWLRRAALAAVACTGGASVLVVDAITAGDPLAFLHAEGGWSALTLGHLGPVNAAQLYITNLALPPRPLAPIFWGALLLPVVLALCVVAWRWDRILAVTAAAIALVPLWFENANSLDRYMVVLVPAWIGALHVVRDRRLAWVAVALAALVGMALNAWWMRGFIDGVWTG